MRGLNKLQAGLALSILLFLVCGYWLVKPEAADQPPYLSFSADKDGTKAWRELLGRKQTVKEWRLAWNHLPAGSNMLLVAIQPAAVGKEEKAELLEWLAKGNDLILFDRNPDGWGQVATELSDQEEKETPAEEAQAQVREITVSPESGLAEDGGALSGEVDTRYRIRPGGGEQPLFADDYGVLASRIPVGKGSITAVLTPNWLTNEKILEHSHFELIWPLFAKSWSAVWVDETHHGFGTKPGLLAVYPAWLVLASVQLGLVLLLWLWLRGKRFGPVHMPRAWTGRRGDETLRAVAAWYERLGYRDEALRHQQRFLRQLLAQRWGLSPSVSAAQAGEAARARWPEQQAARLERLLEDEPPLAAGGDESPRAAMRGVSAKAFVERTRELGEIIAYLEKE